MPQTNNSISSKMTELEISLRDMAIWRMKTSENLVSQGIIDGVPPPYLPCSAKQAKSCILRLKKIEKDKDVLASLDRLYRDIMT